MEVSVYTQIIQAVAAISLGIMFGFFYDLLRALRRRLKLSIIAAVADTAFWIVAGTAVFILGMVIGQGEIRIFMILCIVVGAVLYFISLSKLTLTLCDFILECIIKIIGIIIYPFLCIGKIIKKFAQKIKKCFELISKCGIIKINSLFIRFRKQAAITAGDDLGENKKGRQVYQGADNRPDSIRYGNHNKSAGSNKRRPRRSGSNTRANHRNDSRKRSHGIRS